MSCIVKEIDLPPIDVKSLLGPTPSNSCTYNKGYLRQFIYVCKTCCTIGNIRAGICVGCKHTCHIGHDIIELHTKRNFRCDCGNSKFNNNKCKLEPSKDLINDNNNYNRNFDGIYCTCGKSCVKVSTINKTNDNNNDDNDNDDDEDKKMFQCVICEDWYHSHHLNCNNGIPNVKSYCEFTCSDCMKKHEFLRRYIEKNTIDKDTMNNVLKSGENMMEKLSLNCTMPDKNTENITGSYFWRKDWRSNLCTCNDCKKMYEMENISFIIDPNDRIQVYIRDFLREMDNVAKRYDHVGKYLIEYSNMLLGNGSKRETTNNKHINE